MTLTEASGFSCAEHRGAFVTSDLAIPLICCLDDFMILDIAVEFLTDNRIGKGREFIIAN